MDNDFPRPFDHSVHCEFEAALSGTDARWARASTKLRVCLEEGTTGLNLVHWGNSVESRLRNMRVHSSLVRIGHCVHIATRPRFAVISRHYDT